MYDTQIKSAPTTTCTGDTVTNTEASTLQKGPLTFWKIPSTDARAAKRPLGSRHLAHYIVGIDAVARVCELRLSFFCLRRPKTDTRIQIKP